MTNYHDRERLWFLIIDAIDNLERLEKAKELTDMIWDLNLRDYKTEQDWNRAEILLQSYEQTRDKSLDTALSNLRELVEIMTGPNR